MRITLIKAVSVVLTVVLVAAISGCCEEHRSDQGKPIRLSPIYGSAISGAIIGGVIGYQSEEPGEGAALGAVIFGVGALLGELDRLNEDDEDDNECDREDEVVIQIHNSNGSEQPVVLTRRAGTYFGPKGEHYDHLPTEEQLKPVYGS